MQPQSNNEMFTGINKNRNLPRKARLKAALDKTFFLLKKVRFLGHDISPEGIQTYCETTKRLEKSQITRK